MQELQSQRDEIRDIRRDVTNLSNQQGEVNPHGSLNVTTPRSNRPFNCFKITEFHQPPHFDEELHPPPYGGKKGGFGGSGIPRHFEEILIGFYWSFETTKSSIEVRFHQRSDFGKVWSQIYNQLKIHIEVVSEQPPNDGKFEYYRDLSVECLERARG
ncbi:hypothetical protein M9H77_16739 [Catharanthus roseus]|uniref:Uncharacterized protein n=1 Tax=Catharanthus roseus TaxID=4058 RepID=A0ACC0B2K9_CATRO|nr:hypothetical protein M9H77_16739 [Catharanthus roseus]